MSSNPEPIKPETDRLALDKADTPAAAPDTGKLKTDQIAATQPSEAQPEPKKPKTGQLPTPEGDKPTAPDTGKLKTDQIAANQPSEAQPEPMKPKADQLPTPEGDKPTAPDTGKLKTDQTEVTQPAEAQPKKPTADQLPAPEAGKPATGLKPEPSGPDISAADLAEIALTCPVCGLVNRPGELACSRCGFILAAGGTTRKLDSADEPTKPAAWPTGDVIVTGQAPIVLEVEGKEMKVPVAEVITIGRTSDIPDDSRPDVDLSAFGAGDKGVSRKHIKIKRKNILVYVADLGSTNGTLLNGRRLIPNAERLLRNGDELQLGRLKIKVKF